MYICIKSICYLESLLLVLLISDNRIKKQTKEIPKVQFTQRHIYETIYIISTLLFFYIY
jgi:hypothetical protein